MNNGNLILKTSQDGTNTIFNYKICEHYHSIYGAYTESQHVFITNGLNYCYKKDIKVFEVGFGTGLNAFLSLIEASKSNKKIIYDCIELYPLSNEFAGKLNYAERIEPGFSTHFLQLHKCEWNRQIVITENFQIKKISGDFLKVSLPGKYDIVFFDAFSPEKQPEMWTEELFIKMINSMNEGGILTTYCVKGIVKRALKSAGFKIEILPGPPGKRHMIRAIK